MPSRFTECAGTPVNKGVRGDVRCARTFHFASICFHSSVIWESRSDVQDRLSCSKTVTVFWKVLSVLAQTLTVFRQDSCSRKWGSRLHHSLRWKLALIDVNGCSCDGKWRESEGANRRKCLCTQGLWNVKAFFLKSLRRARSTRTREIAGWFWQKPEKTFCSDWDYVSDGMSACFPLWASSQCKPPATSSIPKGIQSVQKQKQFTRHDR